MDGKLTPARIDAPGALLTPRTDPEWRDAYVTYTYRGTEIVSYHACDDAVREWRELDEDGRYGAVVRMD